MNTLMAWSLAGLAASVLGCVAVWAWDRWQEHHATTTPEATQAPVVPCPTHITVHVTSDTCVTLVLGDDQPLQADDLEAVRRFLVQQFGPPLGRHAYYQTLDAIAAHEARDLDAELAALGGGPR